MMAYVKPILALFIFTFLAGCYIQTKTRKPESDLKTQTQTVSAIDEHIHVDTIIIKKIDTTLNLFKAEALVGITIKGKVHTIVNSASTITYFKNIEFIESINSNNKKISIEVVPHITTSLITEKRLNKIQPKVKYNFLSNGNTAFEFYVEKKIFTAGLGVYQIDFTCGQQNKTIYLFRSK